MHTAFFSKLNQATNKLNPPESAIGREMPIITPWSASVLLPVSLSKMSIENAPSTSSTCTNKGQIALQ